MALLPKEFAKRTLTAIGNGVKRLQESECFKDHHVGDEPHEDAAPAQNLAIYDAPFMETWILWQ